MATPAVAFTVNAETVGDDAVAAQLEAMMIDYKQMLGKHQRMIVDQELVRPVKASDLIPKSKRYKGFERRFKRDRFWPRVYLADRLVKPTKTILVRYHRRTSKSFDRYITRRSHLRSSIFVNSPKSKPWNHVRVFWGDKRKGIYNAGFVIKKHGDFRDDALNKYHGNISRRMNVLFGVVISENNRELARLGLAAGSRLTGGALAKSRAGRHALKKTSRSKRLAAALERAENKEFSKVERGRGQANVVAHKLALRKRRARGRDGRRAASRQSSYDRFVNYSLTSYQRAWDRMWADAGRTGNQNPSIKDYL